MAAAKRDKAILALEAVHAALKPLNADERQRVLASVRTLFGEPSSPSTAGETARASSRASESSAVTIRQLPTRPLAIRELIQEKKPRSHPQFITLFAYYREKYQNQPSFTRDDLKKYYEISRENPPRNYDRDFVETVRKGWIHEDAESSYITSKGIEAVESGFAESGESHSRPGRPRGLKGARRRRGNKPSR